MSRDPSKPRIVLEGLVLAGARLSHRRIAIRGKRIVEAASSAPTWKLGPERILVPGFHDHHTHLVGTFKAPSGPDLEGIATRGECLDAVRRWVDEHGGDRPVLGEGWDESAWDDPRPPTREELDRLAPARPLALRRVCGHLAVANSAAWRELRPDGPDADPKTGRLRENLAMGLPRRWPPPPDAYREGVRRAQEAAARMGVVGADEMGRQETYQAFRAHAETGGVELEINHFFPLESWRDQISDAGRFGDRIGRLRIAGVKGFLDGSIGARTAAVEGSFADRGESGALLWERSPLAEAVRGAAQAGASVALHAIGGRAVRLALDAFEAAGAAPRGRGDLRIEHAEEIDEEICDRASRLGVVLSMQPNFTFRWQGSGGLYERALGRDRARALNPYRSVALRAALRFGSDTMPFGPLLGLRGALGHPDPAQRLDAAEALAAYCRGGIHRGDAPDRWAEGSSATMVLLALPGGDPAAALREGWARVIWTVRDGRTLFCDPGEPLPEAVLEATR